jgi:hypothetical protein
LIIVFIFNAIIGLINTNKDEDFFDDELNTVIFRKKGSESDEFNATFSSANIII